MYGTPVRCYKQVDVNLLDRLSERDWLGGQVKFNATYRHMAEKNVLNKNIVYVELYLAEDFDFCFKMFPEHQALFWYIFFPEQSS